MPYRGFFYFVSQSASSDYRSDPYATERRCLPNRTHGIRYASAPKRTACIKTYAPSKAVRPATAGVSASARKERQSIDPQRIVKAVFVMVLVAVLSAFLGMNAARALAGYVDGSLIPLANAATGESAQGAEGLSTPQSSWERGTVPTLYQDDAQWANRPYGSGTVGDAGAAPLCLSMVSIDALGNADNGPVQVASYAQSAGYANSSDASALLADGAAGLGLAAQEVDANEMAMRRELLNDRPIIAAMATGSFGSTATYVVITGIDEHGQLTVVDPLSRDRTSRHWSFDEITSQATGMWSYAAAE